MAADRWYPMREAPRDGTRVLVTIKASEQGPAEVDVAYWASADHLGIEGWRASESHPGQIFSYADSELMCWMPLPQAGIRPATTPAPWQGEDPGELFGSGI